MKNQLNKGFVAQDLEDKIIIFDEKNSMLHTLNESASYVFRKIKSGWEDEKITSSLVKRYGIAEKRAIQDLKAIRAQFKRKKIFTSPSDAKKSPKGKKA